MEDITTQKSPILRDRLAWRVQEWAALLSIARGTVYQQIKRGELRTVRIGDMQVIPRSEAVRLGLIGRLITTQRKSRPFGAASLFTELHV